jgi:hypothetical protein
MGKILGDHRRAMQSNDQEHRLSEYLVVRNSLEDPTEWWFGGDHPREETPVWLDKKALFAASCRVPWERARQERALRLVFHNLDRSFMQIPSLRYIVPITSTVDLRIGIPRRLVQVEMARLKVALRHYQAVTGKPAASLSALVPRYLDAIPEDPFDSKPIRYRLSRGEEIPWPAPDAAAIPGGAGMAGGPGDPPPPPPAEPKRTIPAGQGILWSVGEDRVDDGGKRQGLRPSRHEQTQPGEDLIYLVPLPRARN